MGVVMGGALCLFHIQVDNQMAGGYTSVLAFPTPPSSGQIDLNYPVVTCFIERLPHKSPLAIVFRVSGILMTSPSLSYSPLIDCRY